MSDQYSRAQDGVHGGDDAGDASPAPLTRGSGVCRGTLEKRELQLFEAGCAWASLYGMQLADVVSVEVSSPSRSRQPPATAALSTSPLPSPANR